MEPSSSSSGCCPRIRDRWGPSTTRSSSTPRPSSPAIRTPRGRRVVLWFTDGDDTASRISSGHVMDRARAKDVMVYAIGLVNEYFNGQRTVGSQPDRGLKKVAEDNGGGYFA